MDKFEYNYYTDLIKKLQKIHGNLPEKDLLSLDNGPLQVEIQMGLTCGGFKCGFCYGKHTQKEDIGNPVTLEEYEKFIDEIKDEVGFIQFAGINTDPLGNPNFIKVFKKIKRDTNLKVGMHTKGLLLTDEIIKELNSKTSYGDFITLSVDTVDKKSYNKLHGLREESNLMDRVLNNIKKLYQYKVDSQSELNINISALLMKDNSSYNNLKEFVETVKDYSDRIRFTFPQIPNLYSELPDYYIEDKQEVYNNLERIIKEYPTENIVYLKFDNDTHDYNFSKCHSQKYLFAVNPSGYVFPCPQVTSPEFYHISYGNIKDNSFKEIWNSERRKEILNMDIEDMKCRICDRKDECINNEVSLNGK